ncbi:MAG: 30S ribosomal protein S17 [Chloroflexi bacterium]|nr:30S ribosomal protein S17 [Chloroflexota bacterium]
MSFERRKIRIGTVVSDKMDKTVVVTVEWRQPYALYKKSVRRRTKFVAHDNENQYKVGDLVRIMEGRPISKTKRWRVVELLNREEIAELQPDEIVIEELAEQETAPVAEAEPEAAIADEEATEEIVAEVETTEEEPEAADEEQPTSGESDEDEGEKETN